VEFGHDERLSRMRTFGGETSSIMAKKKTADVSRKQNRDGGNTFTDCEPEFTFHVPCKAVDALGLTE
jgi:hypothetical protein